MLLSIKVTTRAKKEKIEKLSEDSYKLWVRAVPEDGKANERVIELLADFFNISKSAIFIISGQTSRNKKAEIKNY
jgi:hypothetical protein